MNAQNDNLDLASPSHVSPSTPVRAAALAASGLANIDLQGTPFAVSPSAFLARGSNPQGGAVYSSNNQVVTLTGGGWCGSTQPAPGIFNPFNNRGGAVLSLLHL